MIIKRKKNKVAFTLTELVVSLIILLLVGIIVSKEAVSQTRRRADIEKIQATYDLLEKATMAWQAEKNCMDDITLCVQGARLNGEKNKEIFNDAAKYLPIIASTVDINAKGRFVEGEKLSKVDWLPDETKTFDGYSQSDSTIGVSKYRDRNIYNNAYFMLRNGVTISVNFSDYGSYTGYGFFDINGKEGENKIGVDVFPFSIGADIDSSHPLYEKTAKKFNPYFSSKQYNSYDICNINNDSCNNEKLATNPTAYVLRWNRLP